MPPKRRDPNRPKGLKAARRLTVRHRDRAQWLSPAAEEALFRAAAFLFEGKQEADRFFGSLMMQVRLEQLREVWRDIPDAASLRSLLDGSVRVRIRLARLALREAVVRFPHERLGPVEIETRVVVDETSVRIDLDLEAERILLACAVDSE